MAKDRAQCPWPRRQTREIAMIFKVGVGVTLCQNEGIHEIVILFRPPDVGCLHKKGMQKRVLLAPQNTILFLSE